MNQVSRYVLVFVVASILHAGVEAQAFQEVRVRWEPGPETTTSLLRKVPDLNLNLGGMLPRGIFTVVSRRHSNEDMPQHRAPQVSVQHLVVSGFDAQGRQRSSTLILDPRILRAELSGPTGELSGSVLHHTSTECIVHVPDDTLITELRFYQLLSTAISPLLDPLGSVLLP
jgi:hypothetical protein